MNPLIDDLYGVVPDSMLAELETLPSSLTLRRIASNCVGPHVVQQKRGAFNARLKGRFLQHVGNTERPRLLAMGLDDGIIGRMKHDGILSTHEPAAALCTVDHILSLNFGGNNEFDNMILLPARFNKLKNDLEAAQLRGSANGMVITIVPADPGDKVPYIDCGYRRPEKGLVHESH